jgi:hypothetical protein
MNIEVFCGVLYRACTCRESYEKVITSNFLRNKNQRNDLVFLRNKNEIDAVRNAEVVVVHHVVEEVHHILQYEDRKRCFIYVCELTNYRHEF